MGEDADLSLRAQQHGYKLAWLPIPHQHWRSTSFNSLPGSVRSSILEHNRARLFSSWRHAFATGRVGRFVVYDLWSDGLGDVFCALPHLAAALHAMTKRQRANVVINTPHAELMALLDAPDVRVTRHEDIGALELALGSEGIVAIHSMRDINYALPLDIHGLICGALGLHGASAEQLSTFAAALRALVPADRLPAGLTAGTLLRAAPGIRAHRPSRAGAVGGAGARIAAPVRRPVRHHRAGRAGAAAGPARGRSPGACSICRAGWRRTS